MKAPVAGKKIQKEQKVVPTLIPQGTTDDDEIFAKPYARFTEILDLKQKDLTSRMERLSVYVEQGQAEAKIRCKEFEMQLAYFKELSKLASDYGRQFKKAKKTADNLHRSAMKTMCNPSDVLEIRSLLALLAQPDVRERFTKGVDGALELSKKELSLLDYLDSFVFNPCMVDCPTWEHWQSKLLTSTTLCTAVVNGCAYETVMDGITGREALDLIESIKECAYFKEFLFKGQDVEVASEEVSVEMPEEDCEETIVEPEPVAEPIVEKTADKEIKLDELSFGFEDKEETSVEMPECTTVHFEPSSRDAAEATTDESSAPSAATSTGTVVRWMGTRPVDAAWTRLAASERRRRATRSRAAKTTATRGERTEETTTRSPATGRGTTTTTPPTTATPAAILTSAATSLALALVRAGSTLRDARSLRSGWPTAPRPSSPRPAPPPPPTLCDCPLTHSPHHLSLHSFDTVEINCLYIFGSMDRPVLNSLLCFVQNFRSNPRCEQLVCDYFSAAAVADAHAILARLNGAEAVPNSLIELFDQLRRQGKLPAFAAVDLSPLPLALLGDADDKNELLRELRCLKRFIADALSGKSDEPLSQRCVEEASTPTSGRCKLNLAASSPEFPLISHMTPLQELAQLGAANGDYAPQVATPAQSTPLPASRPAKRKAPSRSLDAAVRKLTDRAAVVKTEPKERSASPPSVWQSQIDPQAYLNMIRMMTPQTSIFPQQPERQCEENQDDEFKNYDDSSPSPSEDIKDLKDDFDMSNDGDKPYTCEHANCNKRFANKFLLKKHQFIHTGLRPHTCPFCNKRFNRKDNLLRHKKTHLQGGEELARHPLAMFLNDPQDDDDRQEVPLC